MFTKVILLTYILCIVEFSQYAIVYLTLRFESPDRLMSRKVCRLCLKS